MATEVMTDTQMAEAPSASSATVPSLSNAEKPSINVSKPTPYTFDLAHLLALDPNPLPSTTQLLSNPTILDTTLSSIARDGAQSLLTALLITCPIKSPPDGLLLHLPASTTPLPRWKPLPKPKAPTKWETFARKKGIGKFGGNLKGGAALDERRKNMVYDEENGEWVKKWGYKGKNKEGEGSDWLVELDDAKAGKEKGLSEGAGIRGEGKRDRMERMRRQERRERRNDARGRKGAGSVK